MIPHYKERCPGVFPFARAAEGMSLWAAARRGAWLPDRLNKIKACG